jgi:hypothetical protein
MDDMRTLLAAAIDECQIYPPMTPDVFAKYILATPSGQKLAEAVAAARAEMAAERRQYGVSMKAALQREDALRAESEALLSLLRGMDYVFQCHCDPIWTGRHLHAPECHWDEGGEEVLAALAARDGAPRT